MKNFKRILAIILAVLMIIPASVFSSFAATEQTENNNSTAGTLIANGNWKLLNYSNGSQNFGHQYDNVGTCETSAEGQMVAYSVASRNTVYAYDARTVLESMNTTAIDGLYFLNSNINSWDGGNKAMKPTVMSYAFTRTQLQGTLNKNTFSATTGFVTDNSMVKDGLVITLLDSDANGYYNTMVANVYVNGAVVSTQSLSCTALYTMYGIANFMTIRDGMLTISCRDTFGSYDQSTTLKVNYTFNNLDISSILLGKDYYFSVGTGYDWNGSTGAYRSANINISRIGTCTTNAVFNPSTWTEDGPAKNSADWQGHGTPTCNHSFGEWSDIESATCTESGLRKKECSICSFVYVETVKELGHDWSAWVETSPASCTTSGRKQRTCSRCPLVETDEIPALNHDWVEISRVEAGCFTDGSITYECSRCTQKKSETIKAKGAHTYVTTYNPYPTLTKSGKEVKVCSVCQDTQTKTVSYDFNIFWSKSIDNNVHIINPSYREYDDTANLVYNSNGITFEDLSVSMNMDLAYYPTNLLMGKIGTDVCNFTFTVTPETHRYSDGHVGYPSVIGTVLTTHPEEYNSFEKTAPASAAFGDECYSLGFYASQAMGKNDGEYTMCLNLCDDVQGKTAGYVGGASGTPLDGYYEQLTWIFVQNDNFCESGGVTLATPIAAGTPVTISIVREYDTVDNVWVMGALVNDEFVQFNGEAYKRLDTKLDYNFGIMAYGYDMNMSTASFKFTDINGQNPAEFNGYKHTCEYTHINVPTATCLVAPYECDMCIYCGDIKNYVEHGVVSDVHVYDGVDNVCKLCGCDLYATVNGNAYASLQKAIDVANNGDTVKLIKNLTTDQTITIEKNITLDMDIKYIRNTSDNCAKPDLLKINGDVTINMSTDSYFRIDRNNAGANLITVDGGNVVINANGSGSYTRARSEQLNGSNIVANGNANVTVNGNTWYQYCSTVDQAKPVFVANDNATITLNATKVYARPAGAVIAYATTDNGKIVGNNVNYNTTYPYTSLIDTAVNTLTGDENNFTVEAASKEPELAVDNYDVILKNMTGISAVRYALGDYDTSSQIKNAPGCITLSASKLKVAGNDRIFTLDNGGFYSVWVRSNEGDFIFKADATQMIQTLSSNHLNLTVSNLYGVSDLFLCNGIYTTYSDVKSHTAARITSVKINGAKSYTYGMPKSGDVTVYVRYADSSRQPEFYYTNLVVPVPTAVSDGLNVYMTGLNDVKCVKRVYGTYSTLAQVKADPSVITLGGGFCKTDPNPVIHVPHEGALTISIQYKSGYTVILNIDIVQKRPTFVQEGNKVTIGNIDDLYIVRYAQGTYSKGSTIKVAPGSQVIRPSAAVDGKIVVTGLAKGTYTFLVQYNEESQNIYHITVK